MRKRVLQPLLLLMSVFGLVGCDDRQPSDDARVVSSVAEPCSPQIQPSLVFYDDKGAPSALAPVLSNEELGSILHEVDERTEEAIWFIRIKPSVIPGERGPVIVYLAPQKQTARIRVGNGHWIWMTGEKAQVYSDPMRYMQVSTADRSFAEQLALPSMRDLPFYRPIVVDPHPEARSPMAEEEVIRIVDFVRDPSNYGEPLDPRAPPKDRMIRDIREMPILRMKRQGNEIQVEFGFVHGGTFGYGQNVTLECTSDGYKITIWGRWVS